MAVKNWRTALKEKVVYISPDGQVYNFHDTELETVLTMTGWGIPPIGKATTRGPFQHGATPLTLRVPTRKVTMTIHNKSCNRNDYWTSRMNLINTIRYNRGGLDSPTPGHLRWYRSDGQIRQLDVILASGPEFTPISAGWSEYSFQDVLVWEADNPIIYNPTQLADITVGLSCTALDQLQFPFTFGEVTGLLFGVSVCTSTATASSSYAGNWMEFPTITIVGPATDFTITHDQLGWKLKLEDYAIAANETVTFDLTYGKKTITNNFGDSLLGYLSTDSEIGLFSIQPDPIVPNGLNTFSIELQLGSGATSVLFQYYSRFIAI